MRVVLDTNVLLRSLPRQSALRPIFDAVITRRITVVLTTSILLEYAEIISRKTSVEVANNVLALLLSPSVFHYQQVYFEFNLVTADPDDNKFTDACVAGQADYLVTDDRHFRVVLASQFPTVRVVSAAEFMEIITGNNLLDNHAIP